MGLLPKSKIEEIKKAKRQEKLNKKRKVAVRPVSISFLIVCEGEKTEPNYFRALIKDRYSDIREVKIEGEGRGTVSLIRKVIEIRDQSQYLDAGVSRQQYINMIEREIRKRTLNPDYHYAKKSVDTFTLLQTVGSEALAIGESIVNCIYIYITRGRALFSRLPRVEVYRASSPLSAICIA